MKKYTPHIGLVAFLSICGTMPLSGQSNTITGTVFQDEDYDQVHDAGEDGMGAVQVKLYRDVNGNGIIDAGDVLIDSVITLPDGTYSFDVPFGYSATSQVAASADDAEENNGTGSVSITSTDLELINDGGSTPQTVGIRFPGLTVPQGATINSAFIDFIVDEPDSGPTSLTVHGENVDNSSAFTTTNNNITSRATTTASAAWNSIPSWSNAGDLHTSADISAVIQEIVNRGGWASGNALSVIITGSSERTAESYDGSASGAPTLRVVYNAPTVDSLIVLLDSTSLDTATLYSTALTHSAVFVSAGEDSTIISAGATWKYLDDGSNQGSAWTATGFNDASWASGGAELGYGDGGETTVVSYGPDPNNKHETTYFRHSFTIANPAQYEQLVLQLQCDDGAVVYLNGNEVHRKNMALGTVTYTTLANFTVAGADETTLFQSIISGADLVAGTNVVAVEIHQINLTSSDLSFDMALSVPAATGRNFGYLGPSPICFAAGDNSDDLHIANRFNGVNRRIGSFGSYPDVEAIALNPARDTLWAADADQLGIVDMSSGSFVPLASTFGTGDGSLGSLAFDDVDGLSFDPTTGILWGSVRRQVAPTDNDLVIQINRSTGAHVPDAFGANVDYLEVTGTNIDPHLDDLAFDPTNGTLYATNTDSDGGITKLITINKSTGVGTVAIADIGINDTEGQGFSNDGFFYVTTGQHSAANERNSFWRVSIATGDTTRLGTFNSGDDFEGCDCLTGQAKNVITGTVYEDNNSDAIFNSGDVGYSGAKVFLYEDMNENDTVDVGDVLDDSTITNSDGTYIFVKNAALKFALTIDFTTLPGNFNMTTDSNETAPFTALGQVDLQNNFGFDDGSGLPVELLSFTATYTGDHVDLAWATAVEIGSDYFDIQRSTDGYQIETIGSVKAMGNSSRVTDYKTVDDNPLKGFTMYRLKQVDLDGSFTYSSWVSVYISKPALAVTVSPNPSLEGTATLTLIGDASEETISLHIADMLGVLIEVPIEFIKTSSGVSCVIPTSLLRPGTYFITGYASDSHISERLVVH